MYGKFDSPQSQSRPEGVVQALVVYILFAAHLSWPHWLAWTWSERTLPVCWCAGAVGAFLLSRRWIRDWTGALFSGGLYSFGPLALYIAHFHEAGACIVAVIPWLLCPWAYSFLLMGRKRTWLKRVADVGLFALPFAFVAVLFRILAQYHLFVMPVHVGQLSRQECLGVAAPLVMVLHGDLFWGLYHVALGAVTLGALRVIRTQYWGLFLPIAGAFAWAILEPGSAVFEVCPLIWWLFPQVLMCIVVGLGIVRLVRGGRADRVWVLGSGLALTGVGVLMLLQSAHFFESFLWFGDPYARLFVTTGKLYVLGAVGFGLIHVLMRYNRRTFWWRAILVCVILGCDIVLCASYIVDRFFA